MASTCPYSQNSSSSQISFFLYHNQSYFNLEIFWIASVNSTIDAELYFYRDTCSLPAMRKNFELKMELEKTWAKVYKTLHPLLLKLFAMSVSDHSRVCRKPESTSSWHMTWLPIVIVSIAIRFSQCGKQSKTFAEEARITNLGWHRGELFHCHNGKRVQREIAPIRSQSF